MLTEYDKALVAVLIPILTWINQKFGLSIPVDPNTLTLIMGAITAAAVYAVPNKPKGV